MCCFSGPVEDVSGTRIFARLDGQRQALVYQMQFSATADLAMVLPLPTPAGSAEDALEFVDLSGYEDLFDDLWSGFPQPRSLSRGRGPNSDSFGELEVVQVGSFEASFVPTLADFERLDARFRLDAGVWDALPQYADWGFAVFKLRSQDHSVHPMALWFPTRQPEAVFFPTVHIHDGGVHARARFDHTLYCQLPPQRHGGTGFAGTWQESDDVARGFVDTERAAGLVAGGDHVYLRTLRGSLENRDTLVELA
jgi:hypothetical protein